jgi:cytochrome P450
MIRREAAASGPRRGDDTVQPETTPEIPSFTSVNNRAPYDYYEQLRETEPSGVHWDAGMNAWMLTKHADCARIHRDEGAFAHPYWDMEGASEVHGGDRGILMLEGEEHTLLHRFLIRFFSVRVVAQYRGEFVGPLIDRLIGRFAGDGRVNLDGALADPLPAYVICALLGVPLDDEEKLANCKKWNEDIMGWSQTFGEDPDALARARSAAKNLADVLLPIIEDRRVNRRDDLLSALWTEGPNLLENWTHSDVLANARVMLFAGAESTSHLLRNCIYLLLTKPELRDELKAKPELIPNFVEETLRYLGVIQFHIRAATEDAEISGCPIAKGDRIHGLLGAANRDPIKFEEPLEFRLERPDAREHLGFGFGPRLCIGANLARAEAAEMVATLLTRFPDITLDESGPEPIMTGGMPRSFSPLPARWTPPPS